MVKQSLYSTGIIMLIAGACLGAPLAELIRGERPEPLILLFILVSHAFAIPQVRQAWGNQSDRSLLAMSILGYLAGIGCGVALIVT